MVGSNAPPQKTLNDLYDLGFARVVLPTFQPLLERLLLRGQLKLRELIPHHLIHSFLGAGRGVIVVLIRPVESKTGTGTVATKA